MDNTFAMPIMIMGFAALALEFLPAKIPDFIPEGAGFFLLRLFRLGEGPGHRPHQPIRANAVVRPERFQRRLGLWAVHAVDLPRVIAQVGQQALYLFCCHRLSLPLNTRNVGTILPVVRS